MSIFTPLNNNGTNIISDNLYRKVRTFYFRDTSSTSFGATVSLAMPITFATPNALISVYLIPEGINLSSCNSVSINGYVSDFYNEAVTSAIYLIDPLENSFEGKVVYIGFDGDYIIVASKYQYLLLNFNLTLTSYGSTQQRIMAVLYAAGDDTITSSGVY